jgi:phosphoglycerate dehydrogenase-like enzyme
MNVIGCDIANHDEQQLRNDTGIIKLVKSYENEVDEADYVSIHLPSIPETRHFVDRSFLSRMKTDAYLINTSRGPIVDEASLFDAIISGQIAGAALDVFEKEPYGPVSHDKDLRLLDNILLTPHVGSSTVEACERMARSCIKNINAAIHKEYDHLDILNPEVLTRLR